MLTKMSRISSPRVPWSNAEGFYYYYDLYETSDSSEDEENTYNDSEYLPPSKKRKPSSELNNNRVANKTCISAFRSIFEVEDGEDERLFASVLKALIPHNEWVEDPEQLRNLLKRARRNGADSLATGGETLLCGGGESVREAVCKKIDDICEIWMDVVFFSTCTTERYARYPVLSPITNQKLMQIILARYLAVVPSDGCATPARVSFTLEMLDNLSNHSFSLPSEEERDEMLARQMYHPLLGWTPNDTLAKAALLFLCLLWELSTLPPPDHLHYTTTAHNLFLQLLINPRLDTLENRAKFRDILQLDYKEFCKTLFFCIARFPRIFDLELKELTYNDIIDDSATSSDKLPLVSTTLSQSTFGLFAESVDFYNNPELCNKIYEKLVLRRDDSFACDLLTFMRKEAEREAEEDFWVTQESGASLALMQSLKIHEAAPPPEPENYSDIPPLPMKETKEQFKKVVGAVSQLDRSPKSAKWAKGNCKRVKKKSSEEWSSSSAESLGEECEFVEETNGEEFFPPLTSTVSWSEREFDRLFSNDKGHSTK